MKKLTIILSLLLVAFLATSEVKLGANIDTEVLNLTSLADVDKQTNGKYKRKDKYTKDGIEYEMHEYQNSKGEVGYTIFITKEEGGIVYKKAIASGIEKTSREYDWVVIQDLTASTTPKI